MVGSAPESEAAPPRKPPEKPTAISATGIRRSSAGKVRRKAKKSP